MCNLCVAPVAVVSQKTAKFILKANKIHGVGTWGYGKTVYIHSKIPVTITCPKHGDFQQRPYHHLRGAGCPKCAIESQTKSTQNFILEANKIHGVDTWGYGKTVYINNRTPVIITCPKHGDFKQRPDDHLRGSGCPRCAIELNASRKTKSTQDFILEANKIHGVGTWGYGGTVYINIITKVTITCSKHGDFQQTPLGHLRGDGCPKCGGTQKKSTQDFILEANKIHNGLYGYNGTVYINNKTPVTITCPNHGTN